MTRRDYERLPIEAFGRQLIVSGDLDPVYIALPKAIVPLTQTYRWLLAYWCFYHCGLACYLSEFSGQEFWRRALLAAHNDVPAPPGGRWPRAKERRHARGDAGVRMITELRARYGDQASGMVAELRVNSTGGIMFSELAHRIKSHYLFGPWIAFKVGDMMERVLGSPINFTGADIFMFKDPTKAALMVYRQKAGLLWNARIKDEPGAIREVVDHLREEFRDLRAPGGRDRGIELQEIETVLCKFKSHLNGHYPLDNDIAEITAGLAGWGETAVKFEAAMPRAES